MIHISIFIIPVYFHVDRGHWYSDLSYVRVYAKGTSRWCMSTVLDVGVLARKALLPQAQYITGNIPSKYLQKSNIMTR